MKASTRPTEHDRFWAKVIKGPRPNDCWIWTGAVADDGYGRFWVQRGGKQRILRPQRFAYEELTGEPLHPSVTLLHACDIPLCVRATTDSSSHLHPGTQQMNMQDRADKRRHANGSSFRWRGVGRSQVHQQSLELRTVLLTNGWEESLIRPLLTGIDPNAPTLF